MKDPFEKQRLEYHAKKNTDISIEKMSKLLELQMTLDSFGNLKGKDGYTPIFGKDYWTPKQVSEIIETIQSSIVIPKDGKDGENATVDYSKIFATVRSHINEMVAKIPVPKDGKDGKPPSKKMMMDIVKGVVENMTAKKVILDGKTVEQMIDQKMVGMRGNKMVVGSANSLEGLLDVDLTGLPRNADHKYILFNGGGQSNIQSDWDVTDTNSDAFIKNKPTVSDTKPDISFPGFISNVIVKDGSVENVAFHVYRNGTPLARKTTVGDPTALQFKVTKTDHTDLTSSLSYDSLGSLVGINNISLAATVNEGDRVGSVLTFTFLADDGTTFERREEIHFEKRTTVPLTTLITTAPTIIDWKNRKFQGIASIDFNTQTTSMSGSQYINASQYTYFRLTLTGNSTFTLNGLDDGESIIVVLVNSSNSTDRTITWTDTDISWKPRKPTLLRGGEELAITLTKIGTVTSGKISSRNTHIDITFPGLEYGYPVLDGYLPGSLGFNVYRNGTVLARKTTDGDPSPLQFKVTKTDHTNLSTTLSYDQLDHQLGFVNVSFESNLHDGDRVGSVLDFELLGEDGIVYTIRKEPHFWKLGGNVRLWSNRSHYGDIKEDTVWQNGNRLYVARQDIATTDTHYNTAPDDDSSSARAAWEPQHLQDTHFRVDGNERGITFGERNNGNQVEMENLTILDVDSNAGRLGLLNREGGLSYVVPSSSFDADDKDTWMKPTDDTTYDIDQEIIDVSGDYTNGYSYQLGDGLVAKDSLKAGLAAELDGKMEIADLPIPLTHTHAFTFRNRSGNAYDFTANDQLFYNLTEDSDGYLDVVISQNKITPQPDFHNDLKIGAYISVAISDGEGGFDTNIYVVKDPHSTISNDADTFESRIFRCKKLEGDITTQPSNGASVIVRVDFGVNLDLSNVSTNDLPIMDTPLNTDYFLGIDGAAHAVKKTRRVDALKPVILTYTTVSSLTPLPVSHDVIYISALANDLAINKPTQSDIPNFKAIQIHIAATSTARALTYDDDLIGDKPTTTIVDKDLDLWLQKKPSGKYTVVYCQEP